jgi:hypothetical protein
VRESSHQVPKPMVHPLHQVHPTSSPTLLPPSESIPSLFIPSGSEIGISPSPILKKKKKIVQVAKEVKDAQVVTKDKLKVKKKEQEASKKNKLLKISKKNM